jgi:hypothetical protein
LRRELAALSLANSVEDPDLQGWVNISLMKYFREQQQPETAIFFGIAGVNAYQAIRKNIAGLDKDVQAGFVQSKSPAYRELAELLVQMDRLGEAEQVLDLLKEQELKEIVRGVPANAAARSGTARAYGGTTQGAGRVDRSRKDGGGPFRTGPAAGQAAAKAPRAPEEDATLKTLETNIEQGNGEIRAYFNTTIAAELTPKAGQGMHPRAWSSPRKAICKTPRRAGTARDGHTASAGPGPCLRNFGYGAHAQES